MKFHSYKIGNHIVYDHRYMKKVKKYLYKKRVKYTDFMYITHSKLSLMLVHDLNIFKIYDANYRMLRNSNK